MNVSATDSRSAKRWWSVGHDSLQRLTPVSNLIRNFKVAPYHIAEAISLNTSKGHASLDISRSKRPKHFSSETYLKHKELLL